jgi:DNA-binding transcriptional ArsR family regulator
VSRVATNVDMAAVGRLIAAPARAAMLEALSDGNTWAVGALARVAQVSQSTASEHLDGLRSGGLVAVERAGRQRLYRLATTEVADALEQLGTLAPPLPPRGLRESSRNEALRLGRTCYDHLAGRLGVEVTESLVAAELVRGAAEAFAPTRKGVRAFAAAGIDVEAQRRGRRPLTRTCLDWSERRPHLGGALGAALLGALEECDGLAHVAGSRAVRLRPSGRALLARLGVRVAA